MRIRPSNDGSFVLKHYHIILELQLAHLRISITKLVTLSDSQGKEHEESFYTINNGQS